MTMEAEAAEARGILQITGHAVAGIGKGIANFAREHLNFNEEGILAKPGNHKKRHHKVRKK